MPLFDHSSGIRITGGNFYDVAGDLNIQNTEQLKSSSHLGIETREYQSEDLQDLSIPVKESRYDERVLSFDGSLGSRTARSKDSLWLSQHPETEAGYESRLHPIHWNTHPTIHHNPSVTDSMPAEYKPAPSVTISGGTFISGNANNMHSSWGKGIDILHRAVALEALHDSADSFPQPKCHPETREDMLNKLWNYATNRGPCDQILWLYGPAGAGKSAIMWSLCERLQEAGRLGGTFFFKRGHPTRGNAKSLFSTIAYRMALRIPDLKGPIAHTVEDDPSLVAATPEIQLRQLILRPCQSLINQAPPVIIIDGLDECDGPQLQYEILRMMGRSLQDHHRGLPVRILISSRPEPDIREMTEPTSRFGSCYYPFNVEQSFEDVRKYLSDEFSRIHDDHRETMMKVARPWPSEAVLETIVRKSSGQFIYASTIIKFVDDKDFRPVDRLAAVMGSNTLETFRPFDALDRLYMEILRPVAGRPRLLDVLCVIFNFRVFTHEIEQLLELQPGDVRLLLRGLHSILSVPSPEEARYISAHHASFRDFLWDSNRSGEFYVCGFEHRLGLVRSILKSLCYTNDNPSLNSVPYVAESAIFSLRKPSCNVPDTGKSRGCDRSRRYDCPHSLRQIS
ncbi:hypothetical protein DFH09DRAFT_570910 [Mycena vulgaris]|nr:hypothetical protein DFH09DRAFT_570910 [Mycena vulgaris]